MDARHFDRTPATLARDALLHIDGGSERTVIVFRGLVWITQDGDARDLVLAEGERFTLDRPGRALLQALRDSRVLIVARAADAVPARRPSLAARGFAAGWFALAAVGSFVERLRRRWTLGRPTTVRSLRSP